MEHTYEEPSPPHLHLSPPHEPEARHVHIEDLLQLVPTLMSRIESLEKDLKQTKETMGHAIVKLVKKVKKLEGALKKRKVVLSDSEDEETEVQGRNISDDPPVSLAQGLITSSKTSVNISGEEISPTTLEAAKTLSKVASQKPTSVDKGRRYKRRKASKGLDFQERDHYSVIMKYLQHLKIYVPSSAKSRREGIDSPMMKKKRFQASKKSKEQILQEEASLTEAIRLDALQREDVSKQIHLDALLAQIMAEEQDQTENNNMDLSEELKQRKTHVSFKLCLTLKMQLECIRAKLEVVKELKESGLEGSK
ncbi:hypothetical protein Tco_0653501 [Tanacetum coccineum]|uniref:Uncharacterized protein n=1 Tax=Tanacetum coccineum TaxID=301880 RepID=A0ABQ4X0R2_9ASTR